MKDTLTNINNQSFNNFMLRIGKASQRAVSCCVPFSPSRGLCKSGEGSWKDLMHFGWGGSHFSS